MSMAKLSNRLTSALLPLGVVALVAGCGGGGVVSGSGGAGTTFVPPSVPQNSQTSKATLTLYVPVRHGSARLRKPKYISPGTAKVSVAAFPAGQASPWPNPVWTTVPTANPSPGPSPTPIAVTMTVDAPLGSTQFNVNTYDANGYLLSGALSSPAPITTNSGSNTITLTLNASAQCIQINNAQTGGTSQSPPDFVMHPLENQTGTQTATFTVTPCDIDGYAIPSGQTLSNSLAFTDMDPRPLSAGRKVKNQVQDPVTFSPSSITQGGDTTVTMTYPSNYNATDTQFIVPTGGTGTPLTWGMIETDPYYYVLVANSAVKDESVSVFGASVEFPQGLIDMGTVPLGHQPGPIVGSGPIDGCAGSGMAQVINTDGTISTLTFPAPSQANPLPLPSVTTLAGTSVSPPVAAAMDHTCKTVIGTADGYLSTLTAAGVYTNPAGGPFSNPSFVSPPPPPAPITAVGALLSGMYVGLGDANGYTNYAVDSNNVGLYPSFAPHVYAMTANSPTQLAIAYEDASGYLHFAIYDETLHAPTVDYNTFLSENVRSIASDGYNVYALTNDTNVYFTPPSNVWTYSLGGTNATAVAVAPNGMAQGYYVDATMNQLFTSVFSAGSQGNTGGSPSGVVVLP